mmetsp:Transcript_62887/g.185738  ORF Transcript_62887/g.185738 Transcript_62887/m.185738 type:complete len:264 (-) Transcript_62887:117-908(-)
MELPGPVSYGAGRQRQGHCLRRKGHIPRSAPRLRPPPPWPDPPRRAPSRARRGLLLPRQRNIPRRGILRGTRGIVPRVRQVQGGDMHGEGSAHVGPPRSSRHYTRRSGAVPRPGGERAGQEGFEEGVDGRPRGVAAPPSTDGHLRVGGRVRRVPRSAQRRHRGGGCDLCLLGRVRARGWTSTEGSAVHQAGGHLRRGAELSRGSDEVPRGPVHESRQRGREEGSGTARETHEGGGPGRSRRGGRRGGVGGARGRGWTSQGRGG